MPKLIVMVRHEVDVPEGATRYGGDLLDEPLWWKWSINSTGAIFGWCTWSAKDKLWKFENSKTVGELPHWTKPIPFPRVVNTSYEKSS